MAIGGFDNEGGNLTLAQFKHYVSLGEIHHYIASTNTGGGQASASARTSAGGAASRSSTAHQARGGTGATGGQDSSSSSAITSWVTAHYKTVTVGGQTLYDLTQARG
jgi:hypothetical protein